MQNEKELIGEIFNGSRAAVEVLVNRYYKEIFSYIYRSTGQYHTSYDLTQEVFIKMMGALNRFDIKSGNFNNWIYKIALNTIRDYFRGRGYRGFRETVEIDEEKCDEDSNVVEIITRMSQREEIKNAIIGLPEFQRDAIILRYYHDMKIKDIAAVMDTTESTIKSRLRQGIEKLKNILKDGEVKDETKFGF